MYLMEEQVKFVTDNWQGFVYLGVVLLIAIALAWWCARPLKSRVERMRPDEEKRINRVTGYYMTDALLQAVVDEKLSQEEAQLIATRVGRILGIEGMLPRKVVDTPSLKEELKRHRNGHAPSVAEKTKTPFSKFFVKA